MLGGQSLECLKLFEMIRTKTEWVFVPDEYTVVILINATTLRHRSNLSTNNLGKDKVPETKYSWNF